MMTEPVRPPEAQAPRRWWRAGVALATAVIGVLAGCLWHGAENAHLLREADREMATWVNCHPASGGAPAQDLRELPLLVGLPTPFAGRPIQTVEILANADWPTASAAATERLLQIEAMLSAAPDAASLSTTLDQRLADLLVRPPQPQQGPVSASLTEPRLEAPRIGEFTLYLHLRSTVRALRGARTSALDDCLGIAALAVAIEAADPAGPGLFDVLLAASRRAAAAERLQLLTPTLAPDRALAERALTAVTRLESAAASRTTIINRHNDRAMALLATITQAGAATATASGRLPRHLGVLVADRRIGRDYNTQYCSELLSLASGSYRQCVGRLQAFVAAQKQARRLAEGHDHEAAWICLDPHDQVLADLLNVPTDMVVRFFHTHFGSHQVLRGAALALAAEAYRRETGAWPSTLADLMAWLPAATACTDDLFGSGPLVYAATPAVTLRSVGMDGRPGTDDDIEFLPLMPPLPAVAGTPVPTSHPVVVPGSGATAGAADR